MFARYVTSLSKLNFKEQLYFTAKVNKMHYKRIQDWLNASEIYIEDNHRKQYLKRSDFAAHFDPHFGCQYKYKLNPDELPPLFVYRFY